MSGNDFGHFLKMSTFGESHGAAVGVVLDGVPPGLEINESDIQIELNRRKPGQSEISTPRKEADLVILLSGLFEGKTTGTPLAMMFRNTNIKSADYSKIADKFRPGHADYSYHMRYGVRDWRGGGRSSGRETAARVAAGAVAKKWLRLQKVEILAWVSAAAGIECESFDPDIIEKNPMRACDKNAAAKMVEKIEKLKKEGNSAGGIISVRVSGLPAGLGSPVFDKLEADLGKAVLSIGAVKGFEIGAGFAAAGMTGIEHNDQMDSSGYRSNNAGGVIGGISTGQDILFRAAVKPTSSISVLQTTRNIKGDTIDIRTEGRHDPIICPRVVPVVEAMTALVLMDHWLLYRALRGKDPIQESLS